MSWRDTARPLIMGIVNATPDSFSGDGVADADTAIAQGLRMIEEGADILDIGGESTRPDAVPVPEADEIARVAPVIAGIRKQNPDILISIDTMKAGTARAALEAGANWINDVTGGRGDPAMLELAAETDCPIILMHNRASWGAAHGADQSRSFDAPDYDDFMADLARDWKQLKDDALAAGVRPTNIILDPGIGFGKSVEQNCQIIRDLAFLKPLGHPILVGPSRKSFIGRILDLPPEERVEGTAAAIALSVANGAHIVRVHDVLAMRRVADMAASIAGLQ